MLQTLKDFGYTNNYNSFVRRIATNTKVNSDNSFVEIDIRGIEKLESIRSDSPLITMSDGLTLQIGLEPVKLIGIYRLYNMILTNTGYQNCFSNKVHLSQLRSKQPSNMLLFTNAVRKLVNENLAVVYWLDDASHLVKVNDKPGLAMLETKEVWLVRPHPNKDHGLLAFTDSCLHIDMPLKHFLMGVNDLDFVLVKRTLG